MKEGKKKIVIREEKTNMKEKRKMKEKMEKE